MTLAHCVPTRPTHAQRRQLSCIGRRETLLVDWCPQMSRGGSSDFCKLTKNIPWYPTGKPLLSSAGRLSLEEGTLLVTILSRSSRVLRGVQWCFAEQELEETLEIILSNSSFHRCELRLTHLFPVMELVCDKHVTGSQD